MRLSFISPSIFAGVFGWLSLQAETYEIPRCEAVPLAHQEVSFRIQGEEKLRWHFGSNDPRPFFYPLNGPDGGCLTRIGHPGAPDHDHHYSVWFAHHDVAGVDFWSNNSKANIGQKQWLAYCDGENEAVMACSLGWYQLGAGGTVILLQQELIAALIPLKDGEYALELQSTYSTPPWQESVALGKTNFGFLAVRLAKSVSELFGGGILTNSEGAQHEQEIFGKKSRWVDYSGPVAIGVGASRKTAIQGITFFDHPENPRYPTPWHVRQDGWMGASFCLEEGYSIARGSPLRLRYLLYAHRNGSNAVASDAIQGEFARRPPFEVVKGTQKQGQWTVRRVELATAPPPPPKP